MHLLQKVYYLFVPYVDGDERAVAKFFARLHERSSRITVRKNLTTLMQQNIAIMNLWSEYRYKGYAYLRKSHRKELYQNLQRIADDFDSFRAEHKPKDDVVARVKKIEPRAHIERERIELLEALTEYFSPKRGVYVYRASSSFGRLLRNPINEQLVGDCNQIVTLYIYIYSRYFDVGDLRIRVLPHHVALHYAGVDIETTNGTFTSYHGKHDQKLLPIEEIVSINLLDTTDSYLETHEVNPEDFLQASRFAYILSHDRDIVTRNLDAAYGMVINVLMKRHNYKRALAFAKQSRNIELLAVVGHNGFVFYNEQHDFKQARRFAKHSPKRTELIHNSYHGEGVFLYNSRRFLDAARAFKKYGDQDAIQSCYRALYSEEQKKLPRDMTTRGIKQHKGTIGHMADYAKKSGDNKLIEHARSLQKHL